MSSLKKNIFANYLSQIYVTLIGMFMVPMYVSYMGAEAYGLVGFFSMLQAWFQLLDMGLTPTMARETARFNGGATDALSLRRLLRALEGIFVGIAVLGAAAIIAMSGEIASGWLKVQHLSLNEVQNAIMLMAIIVALRWVCGLYRGAIYGFERLVWLSGFNILVATARFVLVIPFFIYVGNSPTQFFSYQLALAIIEVTVLAIQTYYFLPAKISGLAIPWDWAPFQKMLKFSLSIAFTSALWVLVHQTDKLVLSKLLPLTDYAYFMLAVLVAGGVSVISGPICNSLLPRLAKLSAAGDDAGLIQLYRNATQMVGVIAIPAALTLAFFSKQVLLAWTGDEHIASSAAPVVTLYALGNGFLALGVFPYYLQYAKGDLKLHMIGSAFFVVLLIPALIWATFKYGVTGAGYAWLITNIVYFIAWTPFVHSRLVQELHYQWLSRDIGPIVFFAMLTITPIKYFFSWENDRTYNAVGITVSFICAVLIASIGSSFFRIVVYKKFLSNLKRKNVFEN